MWNLQTSEFMLYSGQGYSIQDTSVHKKKFCFLILAWNSGVGGKILVDFIRFWNELLRKVWDGSEE